MNILKSKARLLLVGLVVVFSSTSCALQLLRPSGPSATPTPLGDTLSFTMPAYAVNLDPGDTVPGTRLTYLGKTGDRYQVSIDGMPADKRTGDSFIWNGILAPGVHASYNLRLTTSLFGSLPVAGPVVVTLFNPNPVERAIPPETSAKMIFTNIVTSYLIPEGRMVPGTTLRYEGMVIQGEGDQTSKMARLTGVEGYPFLALGDSLIWAGEVRENVLARYSLRVAGLNEDGLRLAGTSELWIEPVFEASSP